MIHSVPSLRRVLPCTVCSLSIILITSTGHAVERDFDDDNANGVWDGGVNAVNWSGDVVPGAADRANIADGHMVTVTGITVPTINSLRVGGNFAGNGNGTLTVSGGGIVNLVDSGGTGDNAQLQVGVNNDTGTLILNDATSELNIGNNFRLGVSNLSTGVMTVNDGTLTSSAATSQVGQSGTGTLSLLGGSGHSINALNVGTNNQPTADGLMIVDLANPADTVSFAAAVNVGLNGKGRFDLIEGTVNANGGWRLAQNALATGARAAEMFIGDGVSTPTLNVGGGNFETANAGEGTVTMESGTLNQNTNNVIVGQANTSNATFNFNGGLIDIQNQLRVGNAGVGLFVQSGGNLNVGTILDIANTNDPASDGTFRMTGGVLNAGDRVNSDIKIGNINNAGASALMEIIDGTVNVSRNIRIADVGANSSGTLVVGDGTTNPIINLNTGAGNNFESADDGTGIFTFRSGTINQANSNFITGQLASSSATVVIGGFATPATYNLNGGNGARDWNTNSGDGDVTILDNGIVNVGRNVNLSNNAAGSFILRLMGGSLDITGALGYRNLGDDEIVISGGSFSVGGALGINVTSSDAVDGNVFHVVGDGATSIDVGGAFIGGAAGVLRFTPSVTGITPIDVGGTVDTNGMDIEFDFSALGSATTAGELLLINKTSGGPIVGLFGGLAEGDTVFEFPDGSAYQISYTGGTGNDLVLATRVLRISEIFYDPPSPEDDWEWIEIVNLGSATVDLAGYVLDDDDFGPIGGANIAGGSIGPGENAILFNVGDVSAADFASAWGAGINLVPVTTWPALANGGDRIGLWTSFADYGARDFGTALQDIDYLDGSGGWPDTTNAQSIYLTDLAADNAVGANWALSTIGGVTPVFTGYSAANGSTNTGDDIGSPADPPVDAIDDSGMTLSNATLMVVDPGSTGSLFANDLGANPALESFEMMSANGATVTVNPDGTFTYDPTAAAALLALQAGDMVFDTFSYALSPSSPPVPGALLEFDASADIDGNGIWESTTATQNRNWSLGANITRDTSPTGAPPGITAAYDFPDSTTIGTTAGNRATAGTYEIFNENADTTWEFWIKVDGTADDQIVWESGGNVDGASLTIFSGEYRFTVKDGGANLVKTAAIPDTTDFHQIVAVYDRDASGTDDSLRLFVDCVESGAAVTGNPIHDWSGSDAAALGGQNGATVGGSGANGDLLEVNNFGGQIAIFRLYQNTAFSLFDIHQNFVAVAGDSATVTIKVTGVNDAPTVPVPIPDVTIMTSSPTLDVPLFPHFEDPDNTDMQLTYTVTMNTNGALIQTEPISSTDGILTLNTPCDLIGTADITVEAEDPGGLTVSDTFTVTVVDDVAPVVPTKDIFINAPAGGSAFADFSTLMAIDKVDGPLPLTCTPDDSNPFSVAGSPHLIMCEATDSSGNTGVGSFNLHVLEIQNTPGPRLLDIVSIRNDPAPGAGGPEGVPANSTILLHNHAFLNNNGDVLHEAALAGAGLNNVVVYKNNTPLAVKGAASPVVGNYGIFDHLTINDAGSAFQSRIGTSVAHFSETGGPVAQGVRVGETAPGTGGATFFNLFKPALSSDGTLVSPGQLDLFVGGVTLDDNTGIWDSAGIVAREGSLSPIGGTVNFGQLKLRVVSAVSSNQIAYASFLVDTAGFDSTNNVALFAGTLGSETLAVREGDIAPGTGGATFDDFLGEAVNSFGQVVVRAGLDLVGGVTVSSNEGLWTNAGGGPLRLVAREDGIAPCLNTDVVRFDRFTTIWIGDDETVCFHAFLKGPSVGPDLVNSTNDGSIWRLDPTSGELHLVAREGGGTNNTSGAIISNIESFACNNTGGVAFHARLVNNTGDTLLTNNSGVWLDKGPDVAPMLVMRRGDSFDPGGGTRNVLTIGFEILSNVGGGTGGYGRNLNDGGMILLKMTLDGSLSGIFTLQMAP